MAEDYRSLNVYPAFKLISTVPDNACVEILLPSACNQVSIGAQGKKLYLAQQGFTEGDNIATNYAFIPSDNFLIIRLGKGTNRASSLFVQSSSGNANVHVILEEVT